MKKMTIFAMTGAIALVFGLAPGQAVSQDYPARPISVVVPFPPGGSADLTIRTVGEKVSKTLGQPFVIENRPGAGGEIAVGLVARAAPDGYTLVSSTNGPVVVIGNFRAISYDPDRDLVPVAMLAKVPTAIAVNASLPVKSVIDLIEYSKKKPGGLSYGMAGLGTHMHLAGEVFRAMTGANLVAVAYKGAAPSALALKSGEVEMDVADLTSLMPFAAEGSIRILGLVDSERTPVAPNIPTIAEAGVPGYGLNAWIGVFAPRGTPPEIVARLNHSINDALALPDVKKLFLKAGFAPWQTAPEEMKTFVHHDLEVWKDALQTANVKLQ